MQKTRKPNALSLEPLSEADLNAMRRRLVAWGAEKVVLFGSQARGDIHEGSDIDLLIVRETDARFVDRIEEVMLLLIDYPAVEPLVYTPAEFERLKVRGSLDKILAEGRVLYDESKR